MNASLFQSFRDPPVYGDTFTSDHGGFRSIAGAEAGPFKESEVAEVLFHGNVGADDWDGNEAAVIRLHDGRLVAWETWWGPTGAGFSEDAYGGTAELWFAPAGLLNTLVLQALTDEGRDLCGIPRDGFGDRRA